MTNPRSICMLSLALALSACQPPAAIGPATGGRGFEPPRFAVLAEPDDPSDTSIEDPSDESGEDTPDTPNEDMADTPVEQPATPPVENPATPPVVENPAETAAGNAVLAAINGVRASNGLTALTLSGELSVLAKAHCTDMVNRHYFNHTTPDGKGPLQRLQAANVEFSVCGETSHYPDLRPQSAIADWLRHPGGKAQMLDGRFTIAGVGMAYDAQEKRHYLNVIYLRP